MSRPLPPLNALRSFEASARHLSFTRAAKELFVTQTAISHQIKALEEYLGTPLFKRLPRKLLLTPSGEELLSVATRSLDQLSEISEAIRNPRSSKKLTVSVTPAFGTQWLVPRLGRFWQQHPDIELQLHHSVHVSDFTDGVDMAVRAGAEANWPGVDTEHLMSLDLIPVCSPILADGREPPKTLSQLNDYPLIHDDSYENWVQWLLNAGVSDVNARRGPLLGDSSATIPAAISGQGLSLERTVFVADQIANGRLVAPFTMSVHDSFCYYVVYPRGALASPLVKAFRDFLFAEAEHERSSQ